VSAGPAASIHARLLNRAKERGEEFNLVLKRYALERFLYRLSLVSPAREVYWLKGALLFDLWFDVPHRPTRARRWTPLSEGLPLGLSDEFAQDAMKRTQWKAFLNKNRLDAPALDAVVTEVRRFVEEPLRLARQR
jgi:hypothetical protein